MALPDVVSGVTAFFKTYRRAFEALDADALSSCLAYPCHFSSASDTVAITVANAPADYLALVGGVIGAYRKLGVSTGRLLAFEVTQLAPALALAMVHWDVRGAADEPLYSFESLYTLARPEGEWRICAIAQNEMPRLQACLAELRARSI